MPSPILFSTFETTGDQADSSLRADTIFEIYIPLVSMTNSARPVAILDKPKSVVNARQRAAKVTSADEVSVVNALVVKDFGGAVMIFVVFVEPPVRVEV